MGIDLDTLVTGISAASARAVADYVKVEAGMFV